MEMSKSAAVPEKVGSLKRVLGLPTAVLLVINMIIGSGIFFKASGVLTVTKGAPGMALAAWIVAGIINLCGGLTIAELSAAMPETGGTVAYMRRIYGDKAGFLSGWTYGFIFYPANIAAQAIVVSTQFRSLFGLEDSWAGIISLAFLTFAFVMNFLGAKSGGRVSNILTVAKLVPVFVIIVAALFYSGGSTKNLTPMFPADTTTVTTFSLFGAAMLSCMFAYDGWQHAPIVAGEVKNPKKNLPIAITAGIVGVCIVYLIINVLYLYVIPPEVLMNSETPGADVARAVLGNGVGATLITVGIMISVFGTLNGGTLAATRIPYSMGVAGELPFSSKFAKLHPKFGTSPLSFAVVYIIAAVMSLLGSFNQVADMSMFCLWIFMIMDFLGVMKLRREMPEMERPYKVPLYPVVPLIGIIGGLIIEFSTLVSQPKIAIIGVILTAAGMIVYYWGKSQRKNREVENAA